MRHRSFQLTKIILCSQQSVNVLLLLPSCGGGGCFYQFIEFHLVVLTERKSLSVSDAYKWWCIGSVSKGGGGHLWRPAGRGTGTLRTAEILKPRCLKGHYLRSHSSQVGWIAYYYNIHIQSDALYVAISQKVTKNVPVSFYSPMPYSGPFFEKIMKWYTIFALQTNYYQIGQRHK